MPPESVGLVGALHLYPDRVAITAGRYEATHPRPLQRRVPAAAFDWKKQRRLWHELVATRVRTLVK